MSNPSTEAERLRERIERFTRAVEDTQGDVSDSDLDALRAASRRLTRALGGGDTPAALKLNCERCGEPFVATRSDARYCSTACRVAAHRSRSR